MHSSVETLDIDEVMMKNWAAVESCCEKPDPDHFLQHGPRTVELGSGFLVQEIRLEDMLVGICGCSTWIVWCVHRPRWHRWEYRCCCPLHSRKIGVCWWSVKPDESCFQIAVSVCHYLLKLKLFCQLRGGHLLQFSFLELCIICSWQFFCWIAFA